MNKKLVVDVSAHQGEIDFSKLVGNVDGIIIRVSVRTYGANSKVLLDDFFKRNVEQAVKFNIPIIGFYSYSECLSDRELLDELDVFFGSIKQYKDLVKIGVFFDYEGYHDSKHRASNSNKAQRTAWFNQYYARAKQEGFVPFLYGSSGNIRLGFALENIPSDTGLWIARYYGGYEKVESDMKFMPSLKGFNEKIKAWQYTSIGKLPGIKGNVDLSWFFNLELSEIKNNPYPEPKGIIKYNPLLQFVARSEVKWLQWELKRLGYYTGIIDGKWFTKTSSAVLQFQLYHPETYTTRQPDLKIGDLSKRVLKEGGK